MGQGGTGTNRDRIGQGGTFHVALQQCYSGSNETERQKTEVIEVDKKGMVIMQINANDIGMLLGFGVSGFGVWWALTEQRMGQLAPALAVVFGLASNYLFNGLAGAGIIEIVARIVVAFIILRLSAELAKRSSRRLPVAMKFAAQQPKIEFEEVNE